MYEIEIAVIYGSPVGAGTPDLRLGAGEDLTVRGSGMGNGINTTNTAQITAGNFDTQNNWIPGTAVADRVFLLTGWHLGNGGTFGVYWAQNVTGANPTIVRAGSVLRYRTL